MEEFRCLPPPDGAPGRDDDGKVPETHLLCGPLHVRKLWPSSQASHPEPVSGLSPSTCPVARGAADRLRRGRKEDTPTRWASSWKVLGPVKGRVSSSEESLTT